VWVVIGLLDECQFLTLRLIKAALDRVRLFKLFKSQDEQFGVVLVRQRSAKTIRKGLVKGMKVGLTGMG